MAGKAKPKSAAKKAQAADEEAHAALDSILRKVVPGYPPSGEQPPARAAKPPPKGGWRPAR